MATTIWERPKVMFIESNGGNSGSGFKYKQLMKQFVDEVDATINPDFCVVRLDKRSDFMAPLLHGIPYMLILHDSDELRTGEYKRYEDMAIQNATTVLSVNQQFLDWAKERHGLSCPSRIIPLKPSIEDMTFEKKPTKPKTAVYAGGLKQPSVGNVNMEYRDYTQYIQKVLDAGWEVHLYSNSPMTVQNWYRNLGCVCHQAIPQAELYCELSQYEVGLQGYGEYTRYLNYCLPNKTWEYLAAGIPTLGFTDYTGLASEVYKSGGWGTTRRLNEKMVTALNRARSIVITDEMRFAQAIEEHSADMSALVNLTSVPYKLPRNGYYTVTRGGIEKYHQRSEFKIGMRPYALSDVD